MYLLDTNILSEIVKRHPDGNVVGRFDGASDENLFTSAICLEEIHFGINTSPDGEAVRQRMEGKVLHRMTVVALDEEVTRVAGELRGEWKLRGTPVSYRDGLIAATAKAGGLILVTRNVRHFDHVAGLQIENWFEAPAGPSSPPN
ncbi:MAG: PIN domain-containing protein [Verrucomicrobiota bacterium]